MKNFNYTMNHKADEAYMAQMLKKRLFLSLIWVVGAALVAGLVVLIFLFQQRKDGFPC